jgi:hypothetical protein
MQQEDCSEWHYTGGHMTACTCNSAQTMNLNAYKLLKVLRWKRIPKRNTDHDERLY